MTGKNLSHSEITKLAKIGITALVDEATGYQDTRERDGLSNLLGEYATEPYLRELHGQLLRLRGGVDGLNSVIHGRISKSTDWAAVIALMRAAPDWDTFGRYLDKALPKGEK